MVTLNAAALAILKPSGALTDRTRLIFPGIKANTTFSDMTLSKQVKAAGKTATVHGFRSSFRDWTAERMATVPGMVAEMAFAHEVGAKTEQAYLRSDLRENIENSNLYRVDLRSRVRASRAVHGSVRPITNAASANFSSSTATGLP